MIKNEGAEQRNEQLRKRLLNEATRWIKGGYSENYAQCQMWASRNIHTSMEDIVEAIREVMKQNQNLNV